MAKSTSKSKLPSGWDEARVKRVLAHYEGQSPEQAALEDDAAFGPNNRTAVSVPASLLPTIRELLKRTQRPGKSTEKHRKVA